MTAVPLCWASLCVCLLFVSADQKNITAESGQDVTLTCRAPDPILIPGVEWSRRDLETQYVLWYWEKQFVPHFQHPSFKDRVDLQDRQMKDGDVSLVLKNVKINDSGTYECCVNQEVEEGQRTVILKSEPISIIHLRVFSPGQDGGKDNGFPALLVFIVLSFVCCASLIKYIKTTKRTEKAAEEKRNTPRASGKSKRPTRTTSAIYRGRKKKL